MEVEKFFINDRHGRRHQATILIDEDCPSPLEDDPHVKMAFFNHRRIANPTPELDSFAAVKRHCRATGAVEFGVEAYIHGGIALALSGQGNFPDRQWDVGWLGCVVIERAFITDAMRWKRLTRKRRQRLERFAASVVDEYGQWMNGDCYGYRLEKENDDGTFAEVDSCFGFIGRGSVGDAVNQALGLC